MDTSKNRSDAKASCEAVSGRRLAVIKTQDENDALQALAGSLNVWIGLSCPLSSGCRNNIGEWRWDDGSRAYFVPSILWDGDASIEEPCIRLEASASRWRDIQCSQEYRYACSTELNLALEKPVVANFVPNLAYGVQLQGVTDGDFGKYSTYVDAGSSRYHKCDFETYIQVDLGSVQTLTSIRRWLYYADGRSYCGQKALLSTTGNFDGQTQVFMCRDYGECGVEDSAGNGRVITFPSTSARYIRYYFGRNTVNDGAHIIELQAFASSGYSKTAFCSQLSTGCENTCNDAHQKCSCVSGAGADPTYGHCLSYATTVAENLGKVFTHWATPRNYGAAADFCRCKGVGSRVWGLGFRRGCRLLQALGFRV